MSSRAWTVVALAVSVIWAGAVVACSQGSDTLVEGDLAFVNVNVLPMDRERLLEHQTVVINGGRIVALGRSDEVVLAEGIEVIDAEDQHLMPGLTEMHGHLPTSQMSDADTRNLLFLYVEHGVTTVRGMQGNPSQFDLRDQISRGLLLGPRLYLGSVSMNGTRVTSPEQAEQLTREHKVAGYDLIKAHEGLTPETFEALARTAEEVGILFGGHVSDHVGL